MQKKVIVKNLTRKAGTGQLVRYILRYVNDETKTGIPKDAFIIKHNIRGNSIEAYIREFKTNEKNRLHKRVNQTAVHHTILSWSPEDAVLLTSEMLKDIAKQYIKLRGIENQYLGTLHNDRDHKHLHIAMSGCQLNGKSSRISQKQFADLKQSLDAYQREKYPELTHSLPAHGAKRRERHTPEQDLGIEQLAELQEIRNRSTEHEQKLEQKTESLAQPGENLSELEELEMMHQFSRRSRELIMER